MSVLAKFYRDQAVIDTPLAQTQGDPIPAGISWMPKGIYRFAGVDYDCTEAGLYRFCDFENEAKVHSRLVYAYPMSVDPDLYGFLSGFSWHSVHATYDAGLAGDLEALAEAGHDHAWGLKCGHLVALSRWFLTDKYGYQTQKINLEATDTMAFMNGHIVTHVYDGGKWKLWDFSSGVIFKKNGVHLSIQEIQSEGVLNCDRIRIDAAEKRGVAYQNGVCTRSVDDLILRENGEDWWFDRMYGGSFTIAT